MSETAPFPVEAPRPQVDSYAPLVLFLAISNVIQESGSGDLVNDPEYHQLPAYDVFQSMNILHSGGVPYGVLNLFFKWEYQDRIFANISGGAGVLTQRDITNRVLPANGTSLQLQWNWGRDEDGTDAFTEAPLYILNVRNNTAQITPSGIGFSLEFTMEVYNEDSGPPTFVQQSFNKNQPGEVDAGPRSWPAGLTVSDIIADIVAFYGWTAQVEPTEGVLDEVIMPANETHNDFIRDSLLPRAHNTYGERFVCYFDRAQTFHFHSARYNGVFVSRAYRAYGDKMGEVINFTPEDGSMFANVQGVNGTHESILSEAGEAFQQFASATTGVDSYGVGRLVNGAEGYIVSTAIAVFSGPPFNVTNLLNAAPLLATKGRTLIDAQQRARAYNRLLADNMGLARLDVRGTHKVRYNDFIVVEYYTAGTGDSTNVYYLSGLYQVWEIEHRVDRGWVTSFLLQRSSIAPPLSADISDGRVILIGTPVDPTIPGDIGDGSVTPTFIDAVFLPDAVTDF